MKYEQRKLGSEQSSTKYCVNENTIITSKQKQTNEEQDNTVRINDGHITISECSDNLKTQNVENVYQGEHAKKNAYIGAREWRTTYMREFMRKKRNAVKATQSAKHASAVKCDNKNDQSKQQEKHKIKKLNTDTCSLKKSICKFHDIVSKGLFYVCSCCDQLWYRHSLRHAEPVRLSFPDISKYLLNKTSVQGIEWLCLTCYNHLKKNKVPPCAVINGLQFPEKPSFFYLNELECRLLAPRLVFQKVMQAPRGKQLIKLVATLPM